jgi:cytochrome P450
LLMAAHDTTASSLTNIVMELAKNPQWQERLRKQSQALSKDCLDYDDLDSMVDFDNVLLEAQRLHPSIPMTWRRSIRECEIEGYTIPPNTLIYMPLLYNYRDPTWWTDPERFDPDRFSPERAEHKRNNFAFTPFGGGAHKCIGLHFASMQVKCFLHQFLLRYRFSVKEGYSPKLMMIPMPKPMDDLPLYLEKI